MLQQRKEELIRIAQELGIPVEENTPITDIVCFLNAQPEIAPELCEALTTILEPPTTISASAAHH